MQHRLPIVTVLLDAGVQLPLSLAAFPVIHAYTDYEAGTEILIRSLQELFTPVYPLLVQGYTPGQLVRSIVRTTFERPIAFISFAGFMVVVWWMWPIIPDTAVSSFFVLLGIGISLLILVWDARRHNQREAELRTIAYQILRERYPSLFQQIDKHKEL